MSRQSRWFFHWFCPDLARSTASSENNDEDNGQPSCLWIPNLRTHNHPRSSDTIKGQMSVSDLDTVTERPQLHTKTQGSQSKIFWSFEQWQSSSNESFVEKNSHGKAEWMIKCSLYQYVVFLQVLLHPAVWSSKSRPIGYTYRFEQNFSWLSYVSSPFGPF